MNKLQIKALALIMCLAVALTPAVFPVLAEEPTAEIKAVSAETETVSEKMTAANDSYAELLCNLGIIGEDFASDAEAAVTMGELAKIVYRALNLKGGYLPQFRPLNMTADDEYAVYITGLREAGYTALSATELFYPEHLADADMLGTLLVDALGYGIYVNSDMPYPANYRAVGARIFKSAEIEDYGVLNRRQAIAMIAAALDAEIVAQKPDGGMELSDKKMIEAYHRLNIGEGRIVMNHRTALSGESTIGEDEVMIGDKVFETGSTNAAQYLGSYVEYYYDDDDVLRGILRSSDEVQIRIPARNIISVSSERSVEYEQGNNTKKLTLADDFDVIYNGMAQFAYSIQMLTPESGYVILTDYNGDGRYDIYDIHCFENIVVGNLNTEDRLIYDNISTRIFDFYEDNGKEFDYFYYDGNSGEIRETVYEKIKRNNVLSIEYSADKSYARVYISAHRIKGKPHELGEDYAVYDGVKVNFSSLYIKELKSSNPNVYPVELRADGECCIDFTGEIAYYRPGTENEAYGYLRSFVPGKGLDDKAQARIFTQDNEWATFDMAENVLLGDEKAEDMNEVYSALCKDGEVVPQLVKYSLNPEGRINQLIIFKDRSTEGDYVGYTDGEFTRDAVLSASRYKVAARCFDKKYASTVNHTWLLGVPESAMDDGKLSENEVSSLGVSYYSNDQTYDVEIYDSDSTGVAAVIICKDDTVYDYEKRLLYVNRVSSVLDENGDTLTALSGFYDGAAKTLMCEDEELASGVLPGDAVAVNIGTDGRIHRLERVATIFRANEGNRGCISLETDKTYAFDGASNVQRSKYGIFVGSVAVINQLTSDFTLYFDNPDDRLMFRGSQVTVLKLNFKRGEYELSDISSIIGTDGYTRVMVHDRYADTQDIVVFEQ